MKPRVSYFRGPPSAREGYFALWENELESFSRNQAGDDLRLIRDHLTRDHPRDKAGEPKAQVQVGWLDSLGG